MPGGEAAKGSKGHTAVEYLSCSQLVTKQCIKLIMVYVIENSMQALLSETEYSLLNTMRLLVAQS